MSEPIYIELSLLPPIGLELSREPPIYINTVALPLECDPIFQAWLASNPFASFLTDEADPVFAAWLASNPFTNFLTEESDPVFAAWKAANMGTDEKETGVDAGELWQMSIANQSLYICTTPGAVGVAVWQKAFLNPTGSLPVDPVEIQVGTHYGGGIVFYILQPDDPGYEAGKKKGFIAAYIESEPYQRFGPNGLINQTLPDLSSGKTNTERILSVIGYEVASAAKYCKQYTITLSGITYNDWYLPSSEELIKMILANEHISITPSPTGSTCYISSYETASNSFLGVLLMVGGSPGSTYYQKTQTQHIVRPIREFSVNMPV